MNLARWEKFFFYLFIFFLPFQKRAIIKNWGLEFNEWTSAFLYLTDILLLPIFVFWLYRRWATNKKGGFFSFLDKADWLALVFLLVSGFSLFWANNLALGAYRWLKLLEFACLFFYLKDGWRIAFFDLKKIFQWLLIGGLVQALIGLGQFFSQQSLGLHRIFEESILGFGLAGVARIDMPGFDLLRAYGTLPHPNLLAIYLAAAIFCLIYLFQKSERRNFLIKLGFVLSAWLLVFALFLTFSRSVILLFIALIFFNLIFSRQRKIWLLILGLVLLTVIILNPEISQRFNPQGLIDTQAVDLRVYYNQIALAMIKESPFWGIGLGQFIWRLPEYISRFSPEKTLVGLSLENWLFQPVHNIFLLIASESGIIGLFIFLFFAGRLFMDYFYQGWLSKLYLLFYLLVFMLLFSIDHYFWSIQQGSLLLWLGLGLLGGQTAETGKNKSALIV